jgi:hypothetical protein
MKTTWMTGCVTGLLALVLAQAPPVWAGQSEWATAGKILTGVVAVKVLGRIWQPAPQTVVVAPPNSYVVYGSAAATPPPPPAVVCAPPEYSQATVILVNPENAAVAPTQTVAVVAQAASSNAPVVIDETSSIMMYNGPEERVIQPKIHGHKAYLQAWSEIHRAWVTLKEHESIW